MTLTYDNLKTWRRRATWLGTRTAQAASVPEPTAARPHTAAPAEPAATALPTPPGLDWAGFEQLLLRVLAPFAEARAALAQSLHDLYEQGALA